VDLATGVALVLVYDSPSEQTLRLSSLWLFPSPRCLGNVGREVARATLCEKQQQTFSRLEKERVGMRGVVTQKWRPSALGESQNNPGP
jgi:hypothetical protein